MAYARFAVRGMVGGGSELGIERSLGRFSDVAPNADFEQGVVEVFFEERKVSLEQLGASIEAAGYSVIGTPVRKDPRVRRRRRLPIAKTNGSCGCV